jgi:methionyl-tRNA formyltransferase
MNIVLLGHEDVASLFAMSLLVAARPAHDYRVFVSGTLPDATATPPALRELAAADAALCKAVRREGRLARAVSAATALPTPNGAAGLAELSAAAPDLVISIRYRRILRDAAIAIPRYGVLNLHSGILPEYAGVMATFWALLGGEAEIGCTLHRIVDAGIDTGPIVAVLRQPADPSASYLANLLALYPSGIAQIAAAIDRIAEGRTVSVRMQSTAGGRYYSTPDAAAVARFLGRGLALTDGCEEALLKYLAVPAADAS